VIPVHAVVAGVSPAIKICCSRHGCRYKSSRNETFHLHMHLAGTMVLDQAPRENPPFDFVTKYSGKFLDKIAVLG
jgi:hypothetical protein